MPDRNKHSLNRQRGSARRGSVLLIGTISLFTLFGVLGLVVDLGWASYKKIQIRTAAEAAAMAAGVYAFNHGSICGSNGVVCGASYTCQNPNVSPPTTALQAGCLYAGTNGFLNGGKQSVTLIQNDTTPPGVSGYNASYWVQAKVSETIPILFLAVNGMQSSTVANSAIAGVTSVPRGSCIYSLDTGDTADAFKASGSITVTSNCGIYVNSSNSKAFDMTGSANVSATQILVSGNYSQGGSGSLTPTPMTGQPTVADPFAPLPSPSVGSCDHTNFNVSSATTLDPGVYCGGIKITGSGDITFNPGIYIVNGGGFNWSGSGNLNGSHVMFYITGQNGQVAAPLSASGSGQLNLTSPNTGAYEGILFYQDRSVIYAGDNTFAGSTSSATTGAFYFPTTSLSYAGSSVGHYQALAAKTIKIVGTSNFLNDTTGQYTGLATRTTSLIY